MANIQEENQIFICYRRDDSDGITGRIYDRLVRKYGKKAIFKDVDSVPLGVNFKTYIGSIIDQCKVVLVIIGERWIEIVDEKGIPRIQAPDDYVRTEIETALRQKKIVIPLTIHKGKMPREIDVPVSIKELIYQNGINIGYDPRFNSDIDSLIRKLEKIFETQPMIEGNVKSSGKDKSNKLAKEDSLREYISEAPKAPDTFPAVNPKEQHIAGNSFRVQITIAVIGLLGALGAAAITNWDKLFPPTNSGPPQTEKSILPTTPTPAPDVSVGQVALPVGKISDREDSVRILDISPTPQSYFHRGRPQKFTIKVEYSLQSANIAILGMSVAQIPESAAKCASKSGGLTDATEVPIVRGRHITAFDLTWSGDSFEATKGRVDMKGYLTFSPSFWQSVGGNRGDIIRVFEGYESLCMRFGP